MQLHLRGILALLIVTVVWGTTFPAMKDLSSDFSAVWIAFLRFVLGGALLSPFLLRARRTDWLAGAGLGAMLFAAFLFQVEALGQMSANRNAFITGLNVLIVPLLGVMAGRMPENRILLAVALAIAGLFAMCWDGGVWSAGDTLALWGAICFGVYVKLMEILTRRASDLMALTAVQILTVAVCAGLWIALVTAEPVNWPGIAQGIGDNFYNLLYLGVVATAAIIALQTWGQRHSSANEAAIVYAFEPACAAIAAYFWLAETMTTRSVLGGLLLISGMIVSQWTPGARPARA
ncbi:MAG TPA: DMT family transporter [Noviherbaspirillum sp.]|uniref:DMT family transporter n=1 Tax=Noviherbaspirillum sp. TaxID=1926288 RepID=UPI002D6A17EB|nr:DMT family transporter [Noviherbaspirillum sp.]HYD96821.1 DMT family transporter [Noviherbaspirillum sp.]